MYMCKKFVCTCINAVMVVGLYSSIWEFTEKEREFTMAMGMFFFKAF